MYLIGILIFLAFLILLTGFVGSPGQMVFVDPASFVVILAVTVPILLASGLLPDLGKGFRLMGSRTNPFSLIELKRIRQALRLTFRTLLMSGCLGTLVGLVALLSALDKPERFGPAIAVAILTFLYALVFSFLLLPISARVNTMIDTLQEDD